MSDVQYRNPSTEDQEETMKTILVPLDGSPRSETVLPLVVALAGGGEYRVTLLSVWEVLPEEVANMGERRARELREHGVNSLRAHLASVAETLARRGIEVTTEVCSGHPAAEILVAMRELQADVIAMASRGRGGVADRVARASRAPVLVLGPRLLEVWPPREVQVKVSSTLVFLEGSAQSEATLPVAMDLARDPGTQGSLVSEPSDVLRKKVEDLIALAATSRPARHWPRSRNGGRR
jgi:nucleotide-binding universal stress UspA family protein